MKNQITTLENYKLSELCKTGGLQEVYNLAVEAASEVCDLSTTAGRKRQRSLAAKVSSSKVLFEKACVAHLQGEELRTKEGRAEVKAFAKDMDALRDSTKETVIAIERLERDELEAYAIAEQMSLDAEKAAQDAIHAEKAMLFAHMEAKEQHSEYKELKTPVDFAKFHFENKENQTGNFDLEKWEAEQEVLNIGAALVERFSDHNPRFVMPEITITDRPLLSSKDENLSGFAPLEYRVIGNIGTDFIELVAAEDLASLHDLTIGVAKDIIESIKLGKITGVELSE